MAARATDWLDTTEKGLASAMSCGDALRRWWLKEKEKAETSTCSPGYFRKGENAGVVCG